jgi:hypothetical protein
MNREEKIAAFLALGGAAVAGAAWWSSRNNGDGGIVDAITDTVNSVVDRVALVTTSEAARMLGLQPEVGAALGTLIAQLAADGLNVYVGQTLRTKAQEQANVDAGKTAAGLKFSWHSIGRAVDLYPVDPDTGKPDLAGKRIDLFRQMHAKAKALGWRGIAFKDDGSKWIITNSRGKGIWDGGHIEWRAPYPTIVAAIAAEGPAYGIA